MQVWFCYIKKKMIITIKMKEGTGVEDRYSLKSQKAHPTGEFVIVTKFGGQMLQHLASRLVNVIRQGGRLET